MLTTSTALIVQSIYAACSRSQSGTRGIARSFSPAIASAKKPLLYAQVDGQLIFGSEFSALLLHPAVSRDVDYEAIHHYLSFICVPAPLTAYRAIRKLQPGHWLLWKNGEIKTERYWQLDFANKIKITEEEAGERVVDLFRDAVKVRLMSEVPLGAFLSGGIDSSAVVALMAEEASEKVKTFSIGFEEQDFSELHHAKRVAEHVGADHHEFIVRPKRDGDSADAGRTLWRAVCRLIRHPQLLCFARDAALCNGGSEWRRRRRMLCRIRAIRGE